LAVGNKVAGAPIHALLGRNRFQARGFLRPQHVRRLTCVGVDALEALGQGVTLASRRHESKAFLKEI
jgi:hypothetical protein